MTLAMKEQNFVQETSLPGPSLVTEWFDHDKCEEAERVRFENNVAYFGYYIGSSKGAL